MRSSTRLARLLVLLPVLMGVLALRPSSEEASAEEVPEGVPIRHVSSFELTPDAKTLVFAWRGDLWSTETTGGAARRLTFHPGRDTAPKVSPDGASIAFMSNRDGTNQVYVMPLDGGTPRRITQHTEGFAPYGWFPDGKALLLRSRLDHGWRRGERLFRRTLEKDAELELLFDDYAGSSRLSPDGTRIAFTREGVSWWRKGYRGSQASQVWIYDLAEKRFTKLTEGEHGERWPRWAADGRRLYVTSQESGTFNVVEVDIASGDRKPITTFEDEGVLFPVVSADGTTMVFRRQFDLWRLRLDAAEEPRKIDVFDVADPTVDPLLRRTLTRAEGVAFTDDAREIAFLAGGDVWVMDTELKEPKQITHTPEEERSIVFSPDHETLYLVSDKGGQPDIWSVKRGDPERHWWQNEDFAWTRVTDDPAPESSLDFIPHSERMAYVSGVGHVWTMNRDGSDRVLLIDSWDPVGWSFAPDGQWIAYSVSDPDFNRDVWIRKTDGSGEPYNVSRHPDYDGSPRWSPDGKLLAFTGQRAHSERDIYYVWLRKADDEEQKRDRTLEKALEKMKGRKKKGKGAGKGAQGKEPTSGAPASDEPGATAEPKDGAAGTWKGRLQGDPPVPPEGLELIVEIRREEDGTLTGTLEIPGTVSGAFDTLTVEEGTGKVSFTVTTPLGVLVGEGTLEGSRLTGTWSIAAIGRGSFEVERQGEAGAEEEAPAAEEGKDTEEKKPEKEKKGPKPVVIDFEGLEDRVRRISIPDAGESRLLWSPDSKKLAFEATINGTRGLWTVAFPDDLKPKKLSSTVGTWSRWLKEGNQIAWIVGGKPATLTASGKATTFAFRVNQTVDLAVRNAAAFDMAWRIMRDRFYDERLNGRDWQAIHARYRPGAETPVAEELEDAVRMMLGELNGSHLGFTASKSFWSRPGWSDVTSHLGVRFDTTFAGPGRKVRDVIRGTPAWEEDHRLHPGDVVLEVNGQAVDAKTWTRAMTGPLQRDLVLTVRREDGKEETLTLRPTSYGAVRVRLYDEALRRRRALVDEASDSTLGYLHVRGMSWRSFEKFEAELYKIGHGKEGLIIDVRDNGGGFTADHLLTVLMQPQHAFTVPRGGGPGYPQDRMVYARWSKPIVVLCNQNSFSNAEIFAHAVQTLGRGKVVGVPTAGGVISTGGTSIMDVGSLRLPFRGWFRLPDGADMEKKGCVPDHVLWPLPGEMPRGEDRQLEKAVEVLLEDVKEAKARPAPRPRYASER